LVCHKIERHAQITSAHKTPDIEGLSKLHSNCQPLSFGFMKACLSMVFTNINSNWDFQQYTPINCKWDESELFSRTLLKQTNVQKSSNSVELPSKLKLCNTFYLLKWKRLLYVMCRLHVS